MTVTDPEEERQLSVSFKGATPQPVIAIGGLPQCTALLMWFTLSPMHHAQTKAVAGNLPSPPADGWNPWTMNGPECDTTYEWEVVTSPGLTQVAASTSAIIPGADGRCGGDTQATRGCSVVTNVPGGLAGARHTQLQGKRSEGVSSACVAPPCVPPGRLCTEHRCTQWRASPLPSPCTWDRTPADGYYQVIVVAYNQYGFKRSEASNIVAVGAPSGDSQPLAVWAGDGDGKISIRFPTPAVRSAGLRVAS